MKTMMTLTMMIWLLAFVAKADQFPADFQWCVATSAHQIEGYNEHSDWWDWEHQPGRIHGGEVSGAATDHWNRLEQDSQLIKDLGVHMYRFSVEWAKIEPKEGQFDTEAINHYKEEIRILKSKGITPMVTLHHFTHPKWFMDQGAWEDNLSPVKFRRFANFVYDQLGAEVDLFITFNEPTVFITVGWGAGLFPPGKQDLDLANDVMINVLRAHALSYDSLRKKARVAGRKIQVGFAHHLRVFDPYVSWSPFDQGVAYVADKYFNQAFLNALQTGRFRVALPGMTDRDVFIPGLRDSQDFLGLNYYTRDLLQFDIFEEGMFRRHVNRDAKVTDVDWEVYPEGFSIVAEMLTSRFPQVPIYITENGIADATDRLRPRFLRGHLSEVLKMIDKGVPIKGYCYWSLMDNFEWIEGYGPRFGLYEVDYTTFQRRLRPSGEYFRSMVKANRLLPLPSADSGY